MSMKNVVIVGLLVVLVGLVALVSLSSECEATDIIVDGGGDGDYLTIQEAIDNSSNGDTVYVWAGTYSENIELNVSISLVGNGSSSTIIDDGDDSAVLNIVNDWCNVTGFNITASNNNGINISSASDVNISDNMIVSNSRNGISGTSYNSSIYSNIIISNTISGIYLSGAVDMNISHNDISSNIHSGISIGDRAEIWYNTIISNQNGIELSGSYCNVFHNNISSSSTYYAIGSVTQSHHTIMYNDIYANANGIVLEDSEHNIIQHNNISSNVGKGIHLFQGWDWGSNYNNISHNNVSSNGDVGISINGGHNVSVFDNIVVANSGSGVVVSDSDAIIFGCNISSNGDTGVYIGFGSDNCSVSNSTIYANDVGIYVADVDVVVENCSIISNLGQGVVVHGSRAVMYYNNISSNAIHGIILVSGNNFICYGNTINTNTLSGIYISSTPQYCVFSHNVISHNGFDAIKISFSGKYNMIDNNTLISESGTYGIELGMFSHHNTIENNTLISENDVGIKLVNSDYNIMQYNNISTNSNQGVWLTSGSDWNTIAFTTFYDNAVGVQIDSCKNNSVYNCTFELNDYGVNITGSSYDNHVYYNEFIENDVQADDGFATIWDDGVSRGNFWSDYLGEDLDGDGIGDTLLNHLGFDQFPIVRALSPEPAPEEEDEVEAGMGSIMQSMLVGILPLIVVVLVFKYLQKNMSDVTVDEKKEMVASGRKRRRGKL